MKRQFLLPDPGEGLAEAEIVAWRVAEGDTVEVNDVLVEIETSKSLVELPSPWAGTVTSLLIAEGTTVDIGTPIIEINDGEPEPHAAPEPEASSPNLVGYGASDGARSRRRGRRRPDESASVTQAVSDAYEPHEPGRRPDEVHPAGEVHAQAVGDPLPTPGRAPSESTLVLASDPNAVRAKPPVRKYAKDLGVDLGSVVGTGPDGTITRTDVEAAAAFQRLADTPQRGRIINDHATFQEPRQETFTAGAGGFPGGGFGADSGFGGQTGGPGPFAGRQERRVPIRGVRKATAENMVRSVRTHVHVTEWTTVDVTATMDFVETLKNRREFTGLRVSPLLVYAKAMCLALARNPDLNTSWDEENQEIVYHPGVNLGIAAATPRGLMVPNIKGADRLSLLELCRALNQLVAVSREGKLQPGDYSGGTFTITNVGVFGVDAGTPIINGNESAIFCMGAIQRRPWVVETGGVEQVVPRWVTTLTVAFDHRIVDGEQGSQFLHDVAEILAEPALALLF
ncbi:2-oxo acid dehydrogenase subunit E2 [Tessaracoccus sp. OS52]|uniref:dihydrolipoamide acetyltransferase family protein n=1 Tax=Tessaracoccus sp. OS52 TaxID=2886691 RepID=UPI001D118AFB|nr:dihydrolipoamide acetyltransferase family protein [Tessaracoccus sp. OS52]MCC2594074.1 2-oxo acid dehydrogenase subunit E2 [Tessaracoccus sp. OS52]